MYVINAGARARTRIRGYVDIVRGLFLGIRLNNEWPWGEDARDDVIIATTP